MDDTAEPPDYKAVEKEMHDSYAARNHGEAMAAALRLIGNRSVPAAVQLSANDILWQSALGRSTDNAIKGLRLVGERLGEDDEIDSGDDEARILERRLVGLLKTIESIIVNMQTLLKQMRPRAVFLDVGSESEGDVSGDGGSDGSDEVYHSADEGEQEGV